jgi:hypothetical protein
MAMTSDTLNTASRGEIIIYQAPGGESKLDVRFAGETLWLSHDQVAALFERDKSVISRHLRNVFRIAELERDSVVA